MFRVKEVQIGQGSHEGPRMKIIGELLKLPQLVYHSYFHQVPKKYDNCERQMNLLTLILSLLKRAMASSSRNALVGTQQTQPYFKVRIINK